MNRSRRKKLQESSWFAVVRAYQECNRRYAQLLHEFDLTIAQFDVLGAVETLGERAMPNAIADELVVTRGNVTGVLQRLKERGLLATRSHERDGRSFICELTSAGSDLLRQARSSAAIFIDQQLAPFDDTELKHTETQMNTMRMHLQTIDPPAIARRVREKGCRTREVSAR